MPRPRLILALVFLLLLHFDPARPAEPDMAGYWSGVLDTGAGKLKVVFQLKQNKDGTWTSQLHSIDQGAVGMATDATTLKDGELNITVKTIAGSFKGKLSADGTQFVGVWSQGGADLPFTVTHVAEVPELMRPQEPKRPYPYESEDITFPNAQAGIKIAGTLTHPPGTGPFPAVILISESDRNGEEAGHHPFLVLADYLTRKGLAVLRTDDRGAGDTPGDKEKQTTPDRVTDVLAGIAYLKTRADVAAGKIGLIGADQGGLAAPLCAVQSPDVAFLVLMAAPGLDGQQLLGLQAMSLTQAYGQGKSAGLQSLNAQAEIFDIIAEETDPAALEKRLRAVITPLITAALPRPPKAGPQADAIKKLTEDIVNQQIKAMTAPEFRFILKYDPQTTLKQVKCPVLAINGELDALTPARQNLHGIETALKAGGNPDVTVKALPKINHMFQQAESNAPTEFARIKETIAPSVLSLVGDWIKAHVQ